MITLVLLLKRKPGLTKEQFRHHYETVHVPLAKKHVGHLFLDYKRHYINSNIGIAPDGNGMVLKAEGEYDAITNIVFENQAAVDEFLRIAALPETAVLAQDEANFLDRSKMSLNFCEAVRTWIAADIAPNA